MNQINTVGDIFTSFVDWLPKLLAAIIVLIIGWIIAKIIQSAVAKALQWLDRRMDRAPEDSMLKKISRHPGRTIGNFFYWLIFLLAISIAIRTLGIPVLSDLVDRVFGYLPNLLAAIVILLAAVAGSILVGGLIMRWMGDSPTGRIVGAVVPAIILSIAGFAILVQLNIAPVIITSTYIAIIGALSLGFALAFGLGGRDTAARIWEQAYTKSTENMGTVREDMRKARERAERDKDRLKKQIKEED